MARGLGRYHSAPPSLRIHSSGCLPAVSKIDVHVLYEALTKRPRHCFAQFARCGVRCLEDLTVFREMRVTAPAMARRIVGIAAMYGVPETAAGLVRDQRDRSDLRGNAQASVLVTGYDADDDQLGDVLGEDRGEV